MRHSPARALVAALVVCSLLLGFGASGASAAFGVRAVTATPVAPSNGSPVGGDPVLADPFQAGGHPDMQIRIDFETGTPVDDSAAGLQIGLAPGIVANVQNVETCDTWDVRSTAETACPRSIVGETTTSVIARLSMPLPPILPAGDIPLTLPGTIYKIPSPDPSRYPTAFGIEIPSSFRALGFPPIKLVSPISVNPSNLGLTASLSGLPDAAASPIGELPIHIESVTQILYGYTDQRASFFTNPTACFDAPVTVSATSHDGATGSGAGSYRPTNCQNVPFETRLSITADPATADSTSAISVNVQPGAAEVPIANSHVRTTTVVTPPGVLLNSSLAAGLDACTDAQFDQRNTAVEVQCPASSRVGDIEFVSPILGPFRGAAYFGTQTATDRLRLFLDVPLFGAHIKVGATVNPDYTTGQITTRFSALPQIAFTSFRLTFVGGSRSALVTPTTCGENVAVADVGPWSGGPASRPSGSFVTTDCARVFAPGFANGVSTPQAGASPTFTLIAERPDRQVPIGRMAFELPPGLVGDLAMDGLTQCALADAAAGNCPASSKVGDVVSVVGSGGEPPSLPGQAYLTVPKQAGDIAGLSIKVPARLGPVDAGTVIVGVRLILRNDGSLQVLSDDIPALQLGIPLAIRRLTVAMNRQGFMRNPTSCGTKQSSATYTPLDGGPTAGATSSLEINGCDRLPFAPTFRARLGAKRQTGENAHPPFTTVIGQTDGESAMKRAIVKTPVTMSTNIRTVGRACDPAVLAQNRCDPSAIVAQATAVSPLISRPLTGPVWLVKRPRGLPSLKVQLRGEASIDLDGIVTPDRRNALITTFDNIPDLTISSFELKFRGGRDGVFTAVRNLCARTLYTSVRFLGQNGRTTHVRQRLPVAGCPKTKPKARGTLRFDGDRGRLGVVATKPVGGRALRVVRVTLPKGTRLAASAKRAVRVKAGRRTLGRRAVKLRARSVTVNLGRRGAARVAFTIPGVTAVNGRVARRLDRGRGNVRIKVGTRLVGGGKSAVKAKIRLR